MPTERCVEVDLGSVDDQQYARTLKLIVDRHDGLGCSSWHQAGPPHRFDRNRS